jgi:DNA-binding response OmpR family regulator
LIRWALAHALSEAGYEVSAAEDGWKALQMAEKECFDFVVTDLVMPGLDGWKLLEKLCRLPAPPRVIVMTAHGDADYPKRVKENGGWAYVEKTSLIDGVKETLREAAAK